MSMLQRWHSKNCDSPLGCLRWEDVSDNPIIQDDLAASCIENCIEFDMRSKTTGPRIQYNSTLFLREMAYVSVYRGQGIEFACPHLVVEFEGPMFGCPDSLLKDVVLAGCKPELTRWTLEVWNAPSSAVFNYMTHPWVFPNEAIDPSQSSKYLCNILLGAYDAEGLDDQGCNKGCLLRPGNKLHRTRVHVHKQGPNWALSPNNAQMHVSNIDQLPVRSAWMLRIVPGQSRAGVSKMLVLTDPMMAANLVKQIQSLRKRHGSVQMRPFMAAIGSEASLIPLVATMLPVLDCARLHDLPHISDIETDCKLEVAQEQPKEAKKEKKKPREEEAAGNNASQRGRKKANSNNNNNNNKRQGADIRDLFGNMTKFKEEAAAKVSPSSSASSASTSSSTSNLLSSMFVSESPPPPAAAMEISREPATWTLK